MNIGIIYLIQPIELKGTNRYKIGISNKPTLERCSQGYKKGSRYLCIMECNNPLILEKNIKKIFCNDFKLIAGNEYFEGCEKDILKMFINLVMEHNTNNQINITNNNQNSNTNTNTNQINNINTEKRYYILSGRYVCKYCNEDYKNQQALLQHNNDEHTFLN